MTRLCGHLCRPLKIYLLSKRSLFHSGGTRVRSNADHMGGARPSMRALYSRPEGIEVSRLLDASGSAAVLSRGAWLRGFESHPPHHFTCHYKERLAPDAFPGKLGR